MNRLTRRETAAPDNGMGGALCNYDQADCNDSCLYDSCGCNWKAKAFAKLKEYEDAEEQGLLMRLPCRLGSKVYVVTRYENGRKFVRTGYDHIGETGYYKTEYGYTYKETNFRLEHLEEFGKRVFSTRREAIEEVSRCREWEAR